jgi:hypothetical protein
MGDDMKELRNDHLDRLRAALTILSRLDSDHG